MSIRELDFRPRPAEAVLRLVRGLALFGCLLGCGPVEAAIFTVNSTGEEVDAAPGNTVCLTGVASCTLRAAIMESNALAGTDTINFSIPGAGPHTIAVLAAGLPAITGTVIIDGYTEPGSVANTLAVGSDAVLMIELDGSLTGGGVNGLTISAAGTTIRGLVINRFADYGIRINSAGAVIRGNRVGTNVAGNAALGNNRDGAGVGGGMVLFAGTATIGGTAPADRNLVSGNTLGFVRGIELWDSNGNTIQGNHIGTTASGTAALGNGGAGIGLDGSAGVGSDGNLIGGAVAGAGNVIGGGAAEAILLSVDSNSNTIQGNWMGIDATGTAPIPNAFQGMKIYSAGNTVGGDAPAKGNVISANTLSGILIEGEAADGNVLENNFVGGDNSGPLDLGNGTYGIVVLGGADNTRIGGVGTGNLISGNGEEGVYVSGASTTGTIVQGNRIGTNAAGTAGMPNILAGIAIVSSATGTRVGGIGAGEGNILAFNGSSGVGVAGAATTASILGNSIHSNGQLGIDLGYDSFFTPNDALDPDAGPNSLLNFPDITAATSSGGSVSVSFLLDVPAGSYRIEFFRNPSGADPSGHGEGQTFVGSRNVTHPGGGAVAFTHVVPAAGGDILTATTTSCTDGATCAAFGITSELSATELVACCSLSTTTGTGTISVSAAGAFNLVFDEAFGGHPTQFYDLAESPIEDAVHDLAGGINTQDGLFLDEITLLADGFNYRSDKGPGANASVLEATATRSLVRGEGYFYRASGFGRAGGIRTVGDWSVYGSGRMALHWERRTTSAVDTTFQQLHLNVHQMAAAPLNGWAGFTDGGPICLVGCPGPAGTDFVLLQNEQAGARTDFLKIQYQDWTGSMESWGSGNLAQEWNEAAWNRVAGDTIPAGSIEGWNFLTYFKPTTFTSGADAAVVNRAADYRGPDDLATPAAPVAGAGWFDPAERTVGPSDFFNEKEATYTLDLDPVAGLNFDMDGAANPRYQPFFKIRQWRGITLPATITLEGVTLTRNVGFKADLMPISRASMHGDLLWYSTLQDGAAVTSPDVGSGGTLTGGVTFEAARFGSGARVSASGDSIRVPTAANFGAARGRIGFWYRPNYDSTDGVLHDLSGFVTDANNYFILEKRADNNLYFRIRAGGGGIAELQVTAANYNWRANEWVHLRITWDDSLPLGTQQRLHINDLEPAHVNPAVDYNAAALVLPAELRFGNTDGDASFGPGVYDEIDVISDTTVLANAGLVGTASEYLADPAPAKNLPLSFAGVDAQGRGRYLFLSTTAKFRGLNFGLATPGAGVAASALEWEYWNGSGWASLESVAGFTDQTNSLTRSGSVFWTADPPGWVPYSLSGGLELYRIRVYLAQGATYGTPPVEGVIRPDILLLQYCGEITLNAQTFVIAPPAPTAVRLQSFGAVEGNASVVLEWRTASELDNLGFHLYRSLSQSGPWTRLTSAMIPGLGSSAVGQAYSFRDTGLHNGTRYYYRLEDIDARSKATSHGPIAAVPSAAARAGDEAGGAVTSAGKPGGSASSCPDWVRAAYGSALGSDTATASLRCTRHGDPEAVSLGVVSRDRHSATLELRTGGFYALQEPAGTVRVFVPGFDFPQDDEAAALPIRRALADAVVGRRVELAGVRALDLASFRGLVPSALGKAEMQVGRDGTVRATRRKPAASQPFPKGELATLLPSLFQGEAKSAVVEIAPFRFDAQRRQLVLAKRVRVRLLFTGREPGESGRGRFGRAPRPRKALASGELLARLHTTARGLHAVTFEQLFPGQSRGVAASQLRLERQGVPVAFQLEPAVGAFGPGSRLYFHADRSAASTDFTAELAYELVRAEGGLVMPVQSAAPGARPIATQAVVSRSFETDRFYQPGLLDAPDPWLWEALASGATRVKSFSLTGVSASGTAELDVFLQGASESGEPVDHHVSASLNGAPLGAAQFKGKSPYRLRLSLPASLLREGPNELSLTSVADTGVSSLVFLDRVSLAHPQTASLANGLFEGTWAASGAASLAGAAADVVAVDVTDGVPRWLTGYEVSGGSVRFAAVAGRRYQVGSRAALFSPRVAKPELSTLKSAANQADYLLIAPRAFLLAAAPLVQRRFDQGLSARAVAFEEIAAEFGHGQASAQAIQGFLAFAFHSWARPSPRYVVLLGDASYDPRNFAGNSPPSPLPALWARTSYLWTASDPQLAAVNGDDGLPDLAIGRLPAANVGEAEVLVRKLLDWEDSGQGLAGDAVLVADNPDLAGDFEANAQDIAQGMLAGRSAVLRLRELGPQTRPRIQAALDSGLSYLSYVGHGGAAVWASENVWNSWDVAGLGAQSRQPLLLTLNCLNGYFVAPAFDSLSESLVKAEGRGAIAAFSPSGLSLDAAAHAYHRALMAELTSGSHARLGDAIAAAQKTYAQGGLMPELLTIYHLLGDPGMSILGGVAR